MSKEEKIEQWLLHLLEGTDCFLVSARLKENANYKFFIDSDTGFSLERSVSINRSLRSKIDEEGLFPNGDYALEISSPGIDEPLTMPRQFKKNIGRVLAIKTTEEEEIEGRLKELSETEMVLEVAKKRKKGQPVTTSIKQINMKSVQRATVQVEFK